MSLTLSKSIYLRASPETVWTWLTDPEKLAIWFHKPDSPLRAGEDYTLYSRDTGNRLIWGSVTEARPYDYLEYTFTIEPLGGAMTTVAWALSPIEGGTRLALEHTGLPDNAEALDLILAMDAGWEEHMGRMRTGLHAA